VEEQRYRVLLPLLEPPTKNAVGLDELGLIRDNEFPFKFSVRTTLLLE
jgi:hypothetical protein